MKKTFKKLVAYICLIASVLTFSACSQFLDLEGAGGYEQVNITVQLQKQMIFCDTGETLSQSSNAINVTFGVDTSATATSSVEAAAKVMRSVVHISISNGQSVSRGSGVIVDIRGGLNENEYYIMTCHHVISSGGAITVSVPDREGRNTGDVGYDSNYAFTGYIGAGKAEDENNSVCLIGGDRDGDIAILKLKVGQRKDENNEPVSIVKATFPNPNAISVSYGEEVFAIGNPTGDLPMTYLHGYISYLERTIALDSVGIMTNVIQHDCAITHGSSGGGLFNMKGQLIGITNAGVTDLTGLSYAIPYYNSSEYGFMYIAKELIESNNAVNYGYVEGRWELGVVVTDSESKVSGSTLKIDSVVQGSNAYGVLKAGDYITAVEFLGTNYTVSSRSSFVSAIFNAREILSTSSSSEIKFTVQRAVA